MINYLGESLFDVMTPQSYRQADEIDYDFQAFWLETFRKAHCKNVITLLMIVTGEI